MYGYTRSHREHALARKGQVGEHNRTGDADELCGRVEALSRAGLEAVDAGTLTCVSWVMIWRLAVSELSYLGRFSYESILERGHRRIVHAHIYPSARAHTRAHHAAYPRHASFTTHQNIPRRSVRLSRTLNHTPHTKLKEAPLGGGARGCSGELLISPRRPCVFSEHTPGGDGRTAHPH